MSPYFFRVEHDLLRSESFRTLGGSAIKVYLVIGLYSDFGTDWAYPSIRTIARQAGLSRQTVLVAVEELARLGLMATSKSKGRSTAYKIIRQGAGPCPGHGQEGEKSDPRQTETGPESLEGYGCNCPRIFRPDPGNWSRFCAGAGPIPRPGRPRGWAQTRTRNERRNDQHPDSGNSLSPLRRGTVARCC